MLRDGCLRKTRAGGNWATEGMMKVEFGSVVSDVIRTWSRFSLEGLVKSMSSMLSVVVLKSPRASLTYIHYPTPLESQVWSHKLAVSCLFRPLTRRSAHSGTSQKTWRTPAHVRIAGFAGVDRYRIAG
jgi:hypothetical protein